MKFQYAHLGWAAKVRTSKRAVKKVAGMPHRSGGWSARDLADEAERVVGACPHVANPEPPTIVYGCTVSEAVVWAESWADQACTANGGKYRKNQPCLAAGVFSCPREMEHIWPAMRDAFVADLQQCERLLSVIEHKDEAHPHVHFYLVPQAGEEFGQVHPGYMQRKEARALAKIGRLKLIPAPQGKRTRGVGYSVGAAYRTAMQAWQDGIFQRVCINFGFERFGPRRQREQRAEYLQNKRESAIASNTVQIEQLLAQAKQDSVDASRASRAAECIRRQLEEEHGQVRKLHKRLRSTEEYRLIGEVDIERRARIEVEEALAAERQGRSAVEIERDALKQKLNDLLNPAASKNKSRMK